MSVGKILHYDTNNRLSQMDYPAGFSVNYAYDNDGRLYTATLGATVLATYGYNTKGQLATVTTGNGAVTTYTYDELNRVTAISAASGATVLWASGYGYDAIGNRTYGTGLYGGTGGDAYQYDNLGQLTGVKYHTATASSGYASATSPASTETTAYDAAGNRASRTVGSTTTSYTANDLNQYTAITSESPAYDGMGNLTSADGWTLGYSPLGQLVSASKTGAPTQTYGFDAFGNRAYEESSGNYSRKLLYVGRQPFDSYETPSGGGTAVAKSYVFGPGIDHPICEVTGNAATINYQLQDVNGNVVALIDAAGAVTERYTYDAWGKPTVYDASWTVQGSAPQSRFLFTGRDYDAETGLYHYRTRAYSPKVGRFLQPDMMDFFGGDLNIYRYVSNNPTNFWDPLGLSACDDYVDSLVDKWSNHTDPKSLGDSLYDNKGETLKKSDGFKPELTNGGQDGAVSRHINGNAGASLQGRGYLSYAQEARDWAEGMFQPGKRMKKLTLRFQMTELGVMSLTPCVTHISQENVRKMLETHYEISLERYYVSNEIYVDLDRGRVANTSHFRN
ncbi:MAG: hypothetical protein PHC88_07050 [Terrimicrobiaceae bacterium]|nr:hypothetical protein [Terrimicrobiaceae bacterium]